MIHVTVLCVGKVKEAFYRQALEEYAKRLDGRYCKFKVVEVGDEPTPDHASETEMKAILEKEGQRILSKIPDNASVITLEIKGKSLTSEEMAAWIGKQASSGESHLCFVIGGSLGLSHEVTKKASLHLSFSAMTFPHQLMRVILAEQIYRSFRILANEPYHK